MPQARLQALALGIGMGLVVLLGVALTRLQHLLACVKTEPVVCWYWVSHFDVGYEYLSYQAKCPLRILNFYK